MAVQLPPVVKTSKRKIPGTRIFDSSRVFADYESYPAKANNNYSSHYTSTFASGLERTNIGHAGKVNLPDPTNVHFLFENPHFINEPVCHASTKALKSKQHQWWPTEIPREAKLTPAYSSNTTNRTDFGDLTERPQGLSRFSCTNGKRKAALGIVPVTELPASAVRTEKISYDHLFDSRRERRERGKLHGSFVWDTTYGAEAKPRRRYAKKHFVCEDTIDMSEVPKQHVIDSQSAAIPTLHQQSAFIVQQVEDQNMDNTAAEKTEIKTRMSFDRQDETNSAPLNTRLRPRRLETLSPPPHLC